MKVRSRKLALAFGSTLVALLLAEVACRVWLSARGTPYVAREMVLQFRELAHRAGDGLPLPGEAPGEAGERRTRPILHPYFGFDSERSLDHAPRDVLAMQRDGDDHYDVLILGGSVAGVFSAEGTRELAHNLEADARLAGLPVRFTSYARGAYKQPQQLFVLGYLLSLGLAPDAVLNIDGFNEVALGNDNAHADTHPSYPSHSQWLPKAIAASGSSDALRERVRLVTERESLRSAAARAAKSGLESSALIGHLVLHWLERREHRLREDSLALLDALGADSALRGPTFEGDATAAIEASVRIWFEASLSMQALCDRRGIDYVQALQPTLHDPGAKPISSDEQRTGAASAEWITGVELGYPQLRARGRELRERGLAFVDCSRVFESHEETLYYDACHFRNPGSEILARRIAEALLEGL